MFLQATQLLIQNQTFHCNFTPKVFSGRHHFLEAKGSGLHAIGYTL